jgi:hypothetical protein
MVGAAAPEVRRATNPATSLAGSEDADVDQPDRRCYRVRQAVNGKDGELREARSQFEFPSRVGDDQIMHDLDGLSLTESVLAHQPGHVPCVKPAGHVMPGGDGAEGAGVVDEA